MVVGGLLIKGARRLRDRIEERNGGRPFADVRVADAAIHASAYPRAGDVVDFRAAGARWIATAE